MGTQAAVRRLKSDYSELIKVVVFDFCNQKCDKLNKFHDPLPYAIAVPNPSNLLELHCLR